MMAAASAWDALAVQLELFAAAYSSVLSDMHGENWSGAASFAMASAVGPYVKWATTTAAQAEHAAGRARAAAAAYEVAFTATVPPMVVAANRIQLAALVATNLFGQNTPAIAAAEAAYAEMWAQDAATMYGYAAESSTAMVLTPFSEPPPTGNANGQSAQAAAVGKSVASPVGQTQTALSGLISTLPQQLQSLVSGAATYSFPADPSAGTAFSSILAAFRDFDTVVVNPAQPFWSTTYAAFSAGQFGTGLRLAELQVAKAAADAATSKGGVLGAGAVRGPVLASVGNAGPVGKLSVPPRWMAANPFVGPTHEPLPMAERDFRAVPAALASPSTITLGGIPMANGEQRAAGSVVLRNGRRAFRMPRPVFGG